MLLSTPGEFSPYGLSHWVVLALFAVVVYLLLRYAHALRGRERALRLLTRCFAVLILATQGPAQIYSMLPANWTLEYSLPFQLCDLAWMVSVYALWTHRSWAISLLYYWGLTLTSQGLITPQFDHDFPHLEYIMFWVLHCLVVLAAILMTWGLGHRPTWRGYCLAVGATVGWGFVMLGFNALADTNYLFVSHKPADPSLLDLLGDWPWYLLWELAIGLSVWFSMTLPWCGWPWRTKRSRGETTG